MSQASYYVSRAAPARVYDYLLGGKNVLAADRVVGDEILGLMPAAAHAARANRAFLRRAVRWVAQAGIRQFIDIGSGMPTAGNTHEVAQEIAPDSRIAYVDNDPVVLAHGRALLEPDKGVVVLEGDLRHPMEILCSSPLGEHIDLEQPVAILLAAVLHHLPEDPWMVTQALTGSTAPGSYLVVSHATHDHLPAEVSQAVLKAYAAVSAPLVPRSLGDITTFFDGLELTEPGVVDVHAWHPELPPAPPSSGEWPTCIYAGVGRKPQEEGSDGD